MDEMWMAGICISFFVMVGAVKINEDRCKVATDTFRMEAISQKAGYFDNNKKEFVWSNGNVIMGE